MQGHVRKRGKKWCFVLDIGRDPETGKRKQKWFSGFNTKKEAQQAMAEKLNDINQGTFSELSRIKYKELLKDWMDQKVKHETAITTQRNYRGALEKHVVPAVGEIPLDQLRPIHFQRLFTELIEKGFSSSTVRLIDTLCRRSLDWAMQMGMVARNPVINTVIPKTERKEMKYWSSEQVAKFLKTAKDSVYYPLFYLALFTGMRLGELRGLKWSDVNWEASQISIRRHIVRAGKVTVVIPGTKKRDTGRVIDISPNVASILKRHWAKQAEQLLAIGGNKEDWMFTTPFGKIIPDITIYKAFIRVSKQASLPRIRFHDLRHTHATLLLQQGVHPKVVSERLGHSSIAMTLDTYSHVIPSMQKEAAAALDHITANEK